MPISQHRIAVSVLSTSALADKRQFGFIEGVQADQLIIGSGYSQKAPTLSGRQDRGGAWTKITPRLTRLATLCEPRFLSVWCV